MHKTDQFFKQFAQGAASGNGSGGVATASVEVSTSDTADVPRGVAKLAAPYFSAISGTLTPSTAPGHNVSAPPPRISSALAANHAHNSSSIPDAYLRPIPSSLLPGAADNFAAAAPVVDDGAITAAHLVADPLAMLRQCIHYITSHPEMYGTNVRGVLDREVMHALRLKASEMSLMNSQSLQGDIPAATTVTPAMAAALASAQNFSPKRGGGAAAGSTAGAVGTTTAAPPLTLPPLRSVAAEGQGKSARGQATVAQISFVQPTTGFFALLESTAVRSNGVAGGTAVPYSNINNRSTNAGTNQHVNGRLSDSKRGRSPLPPHSHHTPTLPVMNESVGWEGTVSAQDDPDASPERLLPASSSGVKATQQDLLVSGGSFRGVGSASGSAAGGATGGLPVLIDGGGYEVSFLRAQLQQVEAAYNSKCIRMHELVEENGRLLGQLKASDESGQKWLEALNKEQAQMEVMRRELDGWKDRAADASMQASTLAHRRHSQARKAATNQLQDVKQEVTKLSQLWRETERALQESRRAFENSEKEANESHDHLSDAFHYIERLERRVERRDAYTRLVSRRQVSLEEKYEKLMWCFRELGTMAGAHSFADFLLADDPIWSCVLFVRTQRHVGDYRAIAAAPSAAESGGALVFQKSPIGGIFLDENFDISLVYNEMAYEATALDDRRNHGRRLRTNLRGTVGCRVLRGFNRFAVDYLGGEDNMPDSCDMNMCKLPLLTLASLLLPLHNSDGTKHIPPSAVAAAAAAAAAAASSPNSGDAPTATEPAAPSLKTPVPNTKSYNQATIRYLLYAFWRGRVAQYKQEMLERRRRAIKVYTMEERKCVRAQRSPSEVLRDEMRGANGEDDEEEEEAQMAALREEEEGCVKNTFLSALVDFAVQLVGASNDLKQFHQQQQQQQQGEEAKMARIQLAVRGVLSMDDNEDEIWDNGRLFFASILPASSRKGKQKPQSFESPVPTATLVPSSFVPEITVKVRELLCALYYYTMEYKDFDADFRLFFLTSHQLIPEMVGVNFYANMEAFKRDCFAMIGQRLHKDGTSATLAKTINGSATVSSHTSAATRTLYEMMDNPLGALGRVAQIIDTTPLIGEDEMVEDDSDGEGYGTILPGRRDLLTTPVSTQRLHSPDKMRLVKSRGDGSVRPATISPEKQQGQRGTVAEVFFNTTMSSQIAVAQGRGSTSPGGKFSASMGLCSTPNQHFQQMNTSVSPYADLHACDKKLLHNIREYLERLHRLPPSAPGAESNKTETQDDNSNTLEKKETNVVTSTQEGDSVAIVTSSDATPLITSEEGARVAEAASNVLSKPILVEESPLPEAWEEVNAQICDVLGPHTSMLRDYQRAAEHYRRSRTATNAPRDGGSSGTRESSFFSNHFRGAREGRALFDTTKARPLAAARGLLHLDDILALVHKHCFATHGLTCCGAPRFSLAGTLCPPDSLVEEDYLDPLDIVGQTPPTEAHLRRLRFALALDQPSSLIRYESMFDIDSHTATPSHFYDEYLTLVLDVFQQQQHLLLESVRAACAQRHEQYAAEGAEDCDGNIPISYLRRGLIRSMANYSVGKEQAYAFADHLVNYDSLLRHDDEMRHEQFTDGPFFLNTRPVSSNGVGEDEDQVWDLQAEAETCSLLHLSLAIRMTYIVWGEDARESAKKLMAAASAVSVVEGAQDKRSSSRGGSGVSRCSTTLLEAGFGSDGYLIVNPAREAEAAVCSVFERSTKALYIRSANRLAAGHSGDCNTLRRLHHVLEEERRIKESQQQKQQQSKSSSASSAAEKPKSGSSFTLPTVHSISNAEAYLPLGYYPNLQRLIRNFTCAPPGPDGNGTSLSVRKRTKVFVDAGTTTGAARLPGAEKRSEINVSLNTNQRRFERADDEFDPAQLSLARLMGLSIGVRAAADAAKKKGGAATGGGKRAKGGAGGDAVALSIALSTFNAVNMTSYLGLLKSRIPQLVGPKMSDMEEVLATAANTKPALGTSLGATNTADSRMNSKQLGTTARGNVVSFADAENSATAYNAGDGAALSWSVAFDSKNTSRKPSRMAQNELGENDSRTSYSSTAAGGSEAALNVSYLHAACAALNLL